MGAEGSAIKWLIGCVKEQELRTSLQTIYGAGVSVWKAEVPRIVRGYTDHGIDHSERVAQRVRQLLSGKDKAKLKKQEYYLLTAAILLHDIGMQCDVNIHTDVAAKAEQLGAVFNVEFAGETADSYSPEQQDAIRRNHHYLTAAWILCAHSFHEGILGEAIRTVPKHLVADLADICLFHSSRPIAECEEHLKVPSRERKRLVAALLRLGDELDIDSKRVSFESVKLLGMRPENAVYWWLHDRIQVEFSTDYQIEVCVFLHPQDAERYGEAIEAAVIRQFELKNRALTEILNDNNMFVSIVNAGIVKREQYDVLPSSSVELLLGTSGRALAESAYDGAVQNALPAPGQSGDWELGEAARRLVDELAAGRQLDQSGVIRLYSGVAARLFGGFTGSVLGNREANSLYGTRGLGGLTPPESYLVFRTMMASRFDCVAGWYFLSDMDIDGVLAWCRYAAEHDTSAGVAQGALDFVALISADEAVRLSRKLVESRIPDVRRTAIGILGRLGEEQDCRLLSELAERGLLARDDVEESTLAVTVKADIMRAWEMISSRSDDIYLRKLSAHDAARIPDAQIVEGLGSTSGYLRAFCAAELVRRGEHLAQVAALITDASFGVRRSAVRASVMLKPTMEPEEFSGLLERAEEPEAGKAPQAGLLPYAIGESELVLGYLSRLPVRQLRELIDWGSTIGRAAYEVLATAHHDTFRAQMRKDIQSGFKGIRERYMRREAAAVVERVVQTQFSQGEIDSVTRRVFGRAARHEIEERWGDLDSFIIGGFRNAALAGIAEHGGSEFLPFVRTVLAEDNWQTRNAAVRALCRIAEAEDLPALFESYGARYPVLQPEVAAAILGVSDDLESVLAVFVAARRARDVRLALGALASKDAARAAASCRQLLNDEDSSIRMAALGTLSELYDDSELEALLASYQTAGTYYYDVVCWLDRLLYSPAGVRELYVKRLCEESAGT